MDDGQIGIFFLKLTSYVCSETINYLQLSVKKKKRQSETLQVSALFYILHHFTWFVDSFLLIQRFTVFLF